MNAHTEAVAIDGPAGSLECAVDRPAAAARAVLVICHPHPQFGGTMDNKVVQTLARAGLQVGALSVRFNFRGVGASSGQWDEGRGELLDALAVVSAFRDPDRPVWLAGFSFGGYVAASAAVQLPQGQRPQRLALIAPSTQKQAVPAVAEELKAETLIVHGEADEVVPLSATLDWARPQGLPVTVVPGVGHFFHGQLALLRTLVVRAWT